MLGEASYWVTWFPGSVLAAIGVLALLWKGVVWFTNATTTLKQVQVALPVIQAEFNPNHGSSMKDRVEALHLKQDKQAEWSVDHAASDRRAFSAQERFNGKVEATLERIEDKLG